MRALKFLLSALMAAMLAGCASYHLGATNGAVEGGRSVEILPFNNKTLQPRLGDAITQALRERIQTDGTYHLSTTADSDVVVTGIIKEYHRVGFGFLNTDVVTPENFQITVIAHVVAREKSSGKLLLDKDVKGHTLVNIGADLASSERQALPLLAADLSQNITEMLTEGAW
jgi:Lipopolysaccharide-assembly